MSLYLKRLSDSLGYPERQNVHNESGEVDLGHHEVVEDEGEHHHVSRAAGVVAAHHARGVGGEGGVPPVSEKDYLVI